MSESSRGVPGEHGDTNGSRKLQYFNHTPFNRLLHFHGDLNVMRLTMCFHFRFNDFSEASMSLSVDTSSPQTRDRSSLIIMSLVEQLAAAYEQQEARRSALVLRLSQSLVKMGLVNPAFAMPELSGLRAQYSLAFLRLMSQVHFK